MKNLILASLLFLSCGHPPINCPVVENKVSLIVYQGIQGDAVSWKDTLVCQRYFQWAVSSNRPFNDYDSAVCETLDKTPLYGGLGPGTIKMLGPNMRHEQDEIYRRIVLNYFPGQKSILFFADSVNSAKKPDTAFVFVTRDAN